MKCSFALFSQERFLVLICFKGRELISLLRRCYTLICFVQLVSQCFADIVAGQVARNISQCNVPCNGQNRCETSCTKSRT